MHEYTAENGKTLRDLAERTIQHYARGLLTVDCLAERLIQAWQAKPLEERSDTRSLEMLARSLCSQALYEGCLSSEARVRELAFENLKKYLEGVLARTGGAVWWSTSDLRADALQQTLVEILQSLRGNKGGPEQPTAFLKWSRVILWRQLSHYRRREPPVSLLSLEDQSEPVLAELLDEKDADPLDAILRLERREELKKAIASLRNPHYREVLLKTFFAGLEERELATLWQVPVADIYLWRCRALKALRKQPALEKVWR